MNWKTEVADYNWGEEGDKVVIVGGKYSVSRVVSDTESLSLTSRNMAYQILHHFQSENIRHNLTEALNHLRTEYGSSGYHVYLIREALIALDRQDVALGVASLRRLAGLWKKTNA